MRFSQVHALKVAIGKGLLKIPKGLAPGDIPDSARLRDTKGGRDMDLPTPGSVGQTLRVHVPNW